MTTYRGYDVYKQSFNSQGPVLLAALNILEQFDLKSMKHNSADYLHASIEALKLAYADRDSYYARPGIRRRAGGRAAVEGVRERARAADRSARARRRRSSPAIRCRSTRRSSVAVLDREYRRRRRAQRTQPAPDAEPLNGIVKDTTHISVIDRDGNVFDSTPSGGWIPSAVDSRQDGHRR